MDEEAASGAAPTQDLRMARSGLRRDMMLSLAGPQAGLKAETTAQLLWAKPLDNQHSDLSQIHRRSEGNCALY